MLMDVGYRLLTKVDAHLFERDLDLHAKHWVIVATPAPRASHPPARRRVSSVEAATDVERFRVNGPWDARYVDVDVPKTMASDSEILVDLTLCNDGWRVWASRDAAAPVNLSYHWIGPGGAAAGYDGVRTPLPRALQPGDTLRMSLVIRTPSAAGHYELQIDLVEEGVTWFSRAGTPPLRAAVRVM